MSLGPGAVLAATLVAASRLAAPDVGTAGAAITDNQPATPAPTTHGNGLKTRFIPLPLYATVPNEGSTYGVMPVFLRTAESGSGSGSDATSGTGGIYAIIAPSVSWNSAAGVGATFRYYRYFDPVRSGSLIAALAQHIDRTLWLQYNDIRRVPRDTTEDLNFLVRRNLFYRFFGFGPDSAQQGESSYTRTTAIASGRWGYNITRDINVGPLLEVRADRPEEHAIFGLPALQVLYPTVPGLNGAALVREGVSVRFDTREQGDFTPTGLASELSLSIAEGIIGVSAFGQIMWITRALYAEKPYLQLAARAYWRQILGGNSSIPFYYQPSLGGDVLLRGYNEDRFFDRGAWEIDVEQRIRLLQIHLFDVISDWRVDPFVAVGQVYDNGAIFSRVRITGGLGFRIWVHPNVLGRVDLAYSDEGFRAYVVLGYPF